MSDPDPNVIKQALSELRDVNKDKRRTAVMKLGMLGGEEAVRALIRIVRSEHEDLIVRGRAAQMLGKLGDRLAVDPLIEALSLRGYQAPLFAAEALGKLGDPRAIAPLLDLFNISTDKTRAAALEALLRLGYDPCPEERPLEERPLEPLPEPGE